MQTQSRTPSQERSYRVILLAIVICLALLVVREEYLAASTGRSLTHTRLSIPSSPLPRWGSRRSAVLGNNDGEPEEDSGDLDYADEDEDSDQPESQISTKDGLNQDLLPAQGSTQVPQATKSTKSTSCKDRVQNFDHIHYSKREGSLFKTKFPEAVNKPGERVLVAVITGKVNERRARAVYSSWGKYVPNLVFISDGPASGEKYKGWAQASFSTTDGGWDMSQQKWLKMLLLWDDCFRDDYDWLIFADDDSFVNFKAVLAFLKSLPEDVREGQQRTAYGQILHLGQGLPCRDMPYPSGSAYMLSRTAVANIVPKLPACWDHTTRACNPASDVAVGGCFKEGGVTLTDAPWQSQPPHFYVSTHQGNKIDRPGFDKNGQNHLSFHYLKPEQMRVVTAHYLEDDEGLLDKDDWYKNWPTIASKYPAPGYI